MSKKTKKAMSMLLVVTLIAVIAVGGMLAYLTDRDSEANVFTVGNVDIDLTEDFDQGSELIPGKDITKDVKVVNEGKNNAWVWVTVAVPADAYKAIEIDKKTADWNWTGPVDTTIDGKAYKEYTVYYNTVLEATKTTTSAMTKVALSDAMDIAPNGDWYLVADGKTTEVGWGSADGNPVIHVCAYAVQEESFQSAEEAAVAYKTQWGTAGNAYGTPAVTVADGDALKAALKAGDDVIFTDDVTTPDSESNGYGSTGIVVNKGQTVYGGGKTLRVEGANGTWDSAVCMKGGTLKDLTIAKGFRGIFVGNGTERIVLENVIVDGPTYTISCDQAGKQGITATDCTFNGWTSYAGTIGDVKFINCDFGEGAGYAFCRPYAPTEFVGCDFAAGYQMDARAAVTFENCTIGGVALTDANLSTLVTSNIANATVK